MRRSVCLSNPGINAIDRMSCSWSIAITLKENHRDGEIIVTWSSSGLRSLPTAIFSLHKWLHIYVKLLKFADDTTVISLIQDSDESAYRQEVEQLAVWCHAQNCRDDSGLQETPPTLPFRFLETIISQELKWDTHIDSIMKKAQQRLYFLHQLKKFNLPQAHMTQFYSAVIESVLCSSITVWFGSTSKSDIRRLQRTVRTADRIIGVHLPSLQDLYNSRVKKRARNIITDPSHPGHNLFALLPSGRHYRSLCTRTLGIKTVFSPCISSLNS